MTTHPVGSDALSPVALEVATPYSTPTPPSQDWLDLICTGCVMRGPRRPGASAQETCLDVQESPGCTHHMPNLGQNPRVKSVSHTPGFSELLCNPHYTLPVVHHFEGHLWFRDTSLAGILVRKWPGAGRTAFLNLYYGLVKVRQCMPVQVPGPIASQFPPSIAWMPGTES